MKFVGRNISVLAAVLVCFSCMAPADLKIKTRTTVMGNSTESTVYIKGPRERSEMSFGGSVTIMQCDQKRIITVTGNQCTVMSMGGETSCPATPDVRTMGKMAEREPALPTKGGVVTITRTSTDTGERQEMFGYKVRHIKSSMTMESTPDACNQSHMKMEMDGWYADLAGFSCSDEPYRSMACGHPGGKRGCRDRIVLKGGGGAPLGFPMKQTTTIMAEHGTFTTTTEVVELTNATLDAPLFDMPSGCRASDMSAMAAGAPATHAEPSPEPAAAAPAAAAKAQPAAAPAPAVAPKAAGIVRVGVVKIKDSSGQSLPTDNLLLNLISEIGRNQVEAVPLDAESPHQNVESEARSKQCDYILYTTLAEVKDPGSGGVSPTSLPKGATLDPAKFQALTDMTLYKVGTPLPEIKQPLAGDAPQFAVDAVMVTFAQASDKVAQQAQADAHPKAPSKTAKPPAKRPATMSKPQ